MKIGKWKLLSEKTCFQNQWWKVVERKFVTPNGKKIDWFVLEKPDAVCVFCLTKQGKLVAIRYFRPGIQKMVYDIPSGFINKGEKPLHAAKRELREETGFKAGKFINLGSYAANAAGDTLMLHCFLALQAEKVSGQNLDHGEEIEVKILTLKQLLAKIKSKDFLDSTRLGVIFMALEKLGKLKIKL